MESEGTGNRVISRNKVEAACAVDVTGMVKLSWPRDTERGRGRLCCLNFRQAPPVFTHTEALAAATSN